MRPLESSCSTHGRLSPWSLATQLLCAQLVLRVFVVLISLCAAEGLPASEVLQGLKDPTVTTLLPTYALPQTVHLFAEGGTVWLFSIEHAAESEPEAALQTPLLVYHAAANDPGHVRAHSRRRLYASPLPWSQHEPYRRGDCLYLLPTNLPKDGAVTLPIYYYTEQVGWRARALSTLPQSVRNAQLAFRLAASPARDGGSIVRELAITRPLSDHPPQRLAWPEHLPQRDLFVLASRLRPNATGAWLCVAQSTQQMTRIWMLRVDSIADMPQAITMLWSATLPDLTTQLPPGWTQDEAVVVSASLAEDGSAIAIWQQVRLSDGEGAAHDLWILVRAMAQACKVVDALDEPTTLAQSAGLLAVLPTSGSIVYMNGSGLCRLP